MGFPRHPPGPEGTSVLQDEPGVFKGKDAPASALTDCSDASMGTYAFLTFPGFCSMLTDPEAQCNDGTPAVMYVRAADPMGPDAPLGVDEMNRETELVRLSNGVLYQASSLDASCVAYHAADEPRVCADSGHMLLHHVSTPWFGKMDLRDPVDGPALYPNIAAFGQAVFNLLGTLPTLPDFAEEEAVTTVPGVFGPNCQEHVYLEVGKFYEVVLADGVTTRSFHDVLWNWVTGGTPTILITNPSAGVTSICPP